MDLAALESSTMDPATVGSGMVDLAVVSSGTAAFFSVVDRHAYSFLVTGLVGVGGGRDVGERMSGGEINLWWGRDKNRMWTPYVPDFFQSDEG